MDDDHYLKIAPYYEILLGKILFPIRQNIRIFIQYCGYSRVLDLCCGTGRQLAMLSSENMYLLGVDSSPAMLEQAAHHHIQFLACSVTDLELPSASYDAVILSLALHEKNEMDRDIILDKSWKYVKPGGHLIVTDYCQVPKKLRSQFLSTCILRLVERLAGKEHYDNYLNWMANGALEKHIESYGTRKEIISSHLGNTILSCAILKPKRDNQFFSLLSEIPRI